MDKRDVKRELNQYKFRQKKVQEALEEYQKYKERAEKVTSILSYMPHEGGPETNKVADNAVIMADLNNQYKYRWARAERERLATIDSINAVEEPYRTLLHMHYIENLKFEEIASKMGYSYVRITHLHGTALEKYKNMTTNDKT